MELQNWLEDNSLSGKINSSILTLNNRKYLILQPKQLEFELGNNRTEVREVLLDQGFDFVLTEVEIDLLVEYQIEDVVFEFGSKWYFSSIGNPRFNILKYVGESLISQQQIDIPHLGIHGKYDICNGSRDYKDWCRKAKFLGISTLGICETDTLAGTLSFQLACQEFGIKSILGETVTIQNDDQLYKLKLYCVNEVGWRNLLNINAQIKVFNEGFVTEDYFFTHTDGLICVIDCSTRLTPRLIDRFRSEYSSNLYYYQFDPVEWGSSTKELEHLEFLKKYVNEYQQFVSPVLICDSYYLDKDETHIRKLLNTVGKVGFQNQSSDQYFKSIFDVVKQLDELFKDEDKSGNFLNLLIENTNGLAHRCDFKIKIGELYLPQYELTNIESLSFDTPQDLFWSLIQKGLEEKVIGKVEDEQVYLDRVQEEVDLLERGGFIDYFLITWDILNWCKQNDILTGYGRGSSAGSLIAYLLDIVKIDPIPFNLLFSRFLNEGRIGKSLPDIDNDVSSAGRDRVKRYIEERYGVDNVTSIGTYGTFKIKAAIKDIGKYLGVDFQKTNYITSFIPDDADLTEIFKIATKSIALRDFLQTYPQVIENYPSIANQPRTISIHAAGIIITPKTYNGQSMTIYDWMPVKKMDGILVTEWEGPQLEIAGYLKEDILGIAQLEKFTEIIKLIKKNHNKDISFNDMDLEEPGVYKLFQEGLNEDVFQFGALGLKGYCKKLKPDNIEDLIATVALYRPGPMESGAHEDFIKLKNKEKIPEYDYMLEDVTKDTYSLYIYQEQIMKAVEILGGLTSVEGDEVRKAMGKKLVDKMEKYRIQFVKGAIKNGCGELDAIRIWNKLEVFAGYGFNRSHAAVYAHTGYFSQWLKFNYPIEFWSVSLHYASQDEISRRIAEIHKVSNVKVVPPDINNSVEVFKPDFQENRIYWSISSIKSIGEKTLENLLLERNTNGVFFSFEEFYHRIKGKGVNKKAILNLILSGCFDIIEKLKNPSDRIFVVKKFYSILVEELPEELRDQDQISKDHFWTLKQKELTGFGFFDFEKVYKANSYILPNVGYMNPEFIQTNQYFNKQTCAVGILTEARERKSVNGPFCELTISSNDDQFTAVMWAEIWPDWRELVLTSKNKIIMLTAEVQYDKKYHLKNIFQTNDKTEFKPL